MITLPPFSPIPRPPLTADEQLVSVPEAVGILGKTGYPKLDWPDPPASWRELWRFASPWKDPFTPPEESPTTVHPDEVGSIMVALFDLFRAVSILLQQGTIRAVVSWEENDDIAGMALPVRRYVEPARVVWGLHLRVEVVDTLCWTSLWPLPDPSNERPRNVDVFVARADVAASTKGKFQAISEMAKRIWATVDRAQTAKNNAVLTAAARVWESGKKVSSPNVKTHMTNAERLKVHPHRNDYEVFNARKNSLGWVPQDDFRKLVKRVRDA